MIQEDYYCNALYQAIDDTFSYLRKKWNIQIIKGLFCECKHFKDFLELHPTLSSKVLSERLKELEQEGILEKTVLNTASGQTEYHLTEKGLRLNKIMFELFNFALDEVEIKNGDFKQKDESKKKLRACLNIK
ncbi:winged helix-turn-helix transcriptional regulator [Methanobacterium aggregans]|uniref:winged helix-turn-helix transcriptional regulator n=1 Tax=Methanobacterium aggregans TaxID=1615586 RepID=UPI001AE39104|nr:helix-turn-helix domain-containing protein [Methanobacterium aggregans]MBP2045287.1 DNA-binding HxlR family transcriptional regulator [Methanobacterium aggregans]